MNETELKKQVEEVFYHFHGGITPAERGLNGFKLWKFRDALGRRQTVAIFARNQEAAVAYAKCQHIVHETFRLVFALPLILFIGICVTIPPIISNDNVWPAMAFLALLVFLSISCWIFYIRCKPLEKKYLDSNNRLDVVVFELSRNGQWRISVYNSNYICVDDD